MPENAFSIELGQWLKATASGDLAVLALAAIIVVWSAIFLFKTSEISRKKAAGGLGNYAGFWPWLSKRLISPRSLGDDDRS